MWLYPIDEQRVGSSMHRRGCVRLTTRERFYAKIYLERLRPHSPVICQNDSEPRFLAPATVAGPKRWMPCPQEKRMKPFNRPWIFLLIAAVMACSVLAGARYYYSTCRGMDACAAAEAESHERDKPSEPQ